MAEPTSRAAWLARDARWIAGVAIIYALAVILSVLLLHSYFSQTWDVQTFIKAGRAFLTSDWAGLYAQSRAEQTWPYAYPPFHALLVAPFVAISGFIPDWLLVRLPPLLLDIGAGLLLYGIVLDKTRTQSLARLALIVWLLNPLTWYDTAVQGHFEAEWLFFVVLAYWLADKRQGVVLPSLALAVAFLFKQNAILFCFPYWMLLLLRGDQTSIPRRLISVAFSGMVLALPVALASLPFVLYSRDYVYLIGQYVAEMPLQTQSWLVGLWGIAGNESFVLQNSSLLIGVAAVVISLAAIRRGFSLWLTALLIALVFFLLSKKVMGYYYVMLLPFAIVVLIAARRFDLLALSVGASATISLSPYFGAGSDPAHWSLYALLGLVNSALWLLIIVWLWRNSPLSAGEGMGVMANSPLRVREALVAFLSPALFVAGVTASIVQPIINNTVSPIRAPLVPPGLEINALIAFAIFVVLCAGAWLLIARLTRTFARQSPIPRGIIAVVVLLAPLSFATFALTKESTAALEMALKTLGL